MTEIDARGQRAKARALMRAAGCSTAGAVMPGAKAELPDDVGAADRAPIASGLRHYDSGQLDAEGALRGGHVPRGRPGAATVSAVDTVKFEDPALALVPTFANSRVAD